jgi:serine/threonine protein kinase
MDLAPGTAIGPYRILRVAGRGAVGVVYLAEHTVLGKQVAIKTLSHLFTGEEVFRQRFTREAQGAASVDHPNILTVFDAGEHEGTPYLVMPYVDGPDLEKVLQQEGGRLPAAVAVEVCAGIADALDAAGRRGLAHRDVKPANILLEGWGEADGRLPRPYLTDFGLVRSSAQATVTRTGQFVGTLLYMSPEQIQSRAVPASDQYSLACVLWECLTGTWPFSPTGSTLTLLTAHLNEPVPAISGRPGGAWAPALDQVFWRALAKSPDDRFPTCRAFVDEATRALGLGSAAPVVPAEPPRSVTGEVPRSAAARALVAAPPVPPGPLGGAPPTSVIPVGRPSGGPAWSTPGPAAPLGGLPPPGGPSPGGTYVPAGLSPEQARGAAADRSGRPVLVAGAVLLLLVVVLAVVVLASR